MIASRSLIRINLFMNVSKTVAFLLTGLRHPYAPIKPEKRRNKSAGQPNSLWEVKWAMHQGMCSGE